MSIVTIPEGLLVQQQSFGSNNFDLEFQGGDTGANQVSVLGPPRWTCSLSSSEDLDDEQAAAWSALVLGLEGRVNFLAVYDLRKQEPKGTLRGTPTMAAAGAAGAASIQVRGVAGATLKRGDWIGVNQGGNNRQLLHVQADVAATAGGVLTVSFMPRLRVPVANGSAVVWNRPTCLMRRNTQETGWSNRGAVQGGFQTELMEHWF